jgi:hypothetical protein
MPTAPALSVRGNHLPRTFWRIEICILGWGTCVSSQNYLCVCMIYTQKRSFLAFLVQKSTSFTACFITLFT